MGTRKLVIEIIVRVVDPDGTAPADVDALSGDGDVLPIYSLDATPVPLRSGLRTPSSVAALEPLRAGADVVMGGRRWHRAAAGFGLVAIALAAVAVPRWRAEAVTPAPAAASVPATTAPAGPDQASPSLHAAGIDTDAAGIPVLRSLGGECRVVSAQCCVSVAPGARTC